MSQIAIDVVLLQILDSVNGHKDMKPPNHEIYAHLAAEVQTLCEIYDKF